MAERDSTDQPEANRQETAFENPTFGEAELDVFRALVREVLGDRVPTQWQGVAQADYMARKLPHDLSAAQAAAVHALVACEAIYSASQLDELDAGTQAIYDSGVAHANAADALNRLASHLPIQQEAACSRLARLLRDEAGLHATSAPLTVEQSNGTPDTSTPWIESPEMALCLSDLHGWGSDVWKGKLSTPPKWLQGHMFRRGEQGKRANSWQPVLMIEAIIQHAPNKKTNLELARKKFKTSPHLKPWEAAWDEHVALMY